MNFQSLINEKNRFGYTSCKQCKKPSLVLDFATQMAYCTTCNRKVAIPQEIVKNHLIPKQTTSIIS